MARTHDPRIEDLGPEYGRSTATSGTTYHLHHRPGTTDLALYIYDRSAGEAVLVRCDLPLSAVDEIDTYADDADEEMRVLMAECY